jgi:rhodanese-related sulfurtransferase
MAQPDRPRNSARRAAILALPALAAGAYWAWGEHAAPGPALSPGEALAEAEAGRLVIADIRRPDEWARTGLARPAHPLDMRREDFAFALAALRGDLPAALICARGGRSLRLQARLLGAGLTGILDIPEGMEGSGAGPGWIARGLPIRPFA